MFLYFQVLDAVGLEERFKKTLPLLTRQIEGLKLLHKARKPRPDDDKKVFLHVIFDLISMMGLHVAKKLKTVFS